MKGKVVMRFVGNKQEPEEEPVVNDFLSVLSEQRKLFDAWAAEFQKIECERLAAALQIPAELFR